MEFSLVVVVFFLFGWLVHAKRNYRVMVMPKSEEDDWVMGKKADPLVLAAPLAVAAVCSDGNIVLIATHPPEEEEEFGSDWQEHYFGVSRIHLVDDVGSAMVCCGWRTDGECLARVCRSLARRCDNAAVLAQQTALWMAQQCIKARPLSTAALLASRGQLFLVDATGCYPVSAHAMGKDAMPLHNTTTTTTTNRTIAQLMNRMQSNETTLSNRTRIEVAVVDAKQKTLRRIRRYPFLVQINQDDDDEQQDSKEKEQNEEHSEDDEET